MRLAYRATAAQALYLVPCTLLVAWLGLHSVGANQVAAGLVLAAAFVPAALVAQYVAAVFQGRLMMSAFFAIRLSMPVVTAIGLLAATLLAETTIWTVVALYLVAMLLMVGLSISLPLLVNQGRGSPAGSGAALPFSRREFVEFGLRGLPGSLYPVENLYLDQVVVGVFLGAHDLGLYVSAAAFTSLPRVLAYSLGLNALPAVAQNPADRQWEVTLRFVWLSVILLVPAGLGLVLLMPVLLPALFGPAFNGAIDPARFLVLGSVAFGVRATLGNCMRGAGRPGVVSIVEMSSWPLTVVAAAGGATVGLSEMTVGLLVVQVLSLILLAGVSRTRLSPDAPGPSTT